MIRPAPQRGYILLPVIVVITLVAAIALLMSTESALESNTAASELDARQADYVAAAGLNHALWLTQQQGCGPYSDLTDEPLGNDKYSSKLTTDLGGTNAVTISVDQDSWIRSDLPTDNKAADLKLHTRNETLGTERPLLRYDLSPLAAKAQILSATAWFYITNAHAAGPIDIHLTSADWTETDATWDSMNANMDSAVLASIPSQPDTGLWIPVNLTAQVQAWVNGEPNYGITLNSTVDGVHGQYSSRESANPPYLEVIVGTPPAKLAKLRADGELANGVKRTIKSRDVTLVQHPPAFSLSRVTAGSGQDAMLDSFYNNRDYGVHELEVSLGSGSTVEISLLQFELPAIAPGARIISARLDLYHDVTTRSAGTPVVEVHRVTRSWIEGSHDGTGTADGATWETWDGSSNWTSAGGDYEALAATSSEISPATGDWESWEIGSLVQGWFDGRYSNHGLLLKGTGDFDISFASKEDPDPALHPKLSISYTCACGEVCVAPQGSGNLLLVVVNPTVLVAEDQRAKDLFESWGYTVNIISESDNQSVFDSAFAVNDVVFISESVNSNTLGTRLDSAPIGVVSQDGDYNPDLGLASGAVLKVGREIDIVSTDHYITRPFAVGPLAIYAQGMEQLVTTGALTADQQILAEIGGDASLVALEKGDAMEGGGNAAGRRGGLPLGTRYRFDWNYLNANGRLLVQRALEWGAGNDAASCGSTTPLMFVVGDPAALTAQEQLRQALLESWCYAVKAIDDAAPQGDYDATATSAAVAYISAAADHNQVGDKLKAATIGIVNENPSLHAVFGFSTVRYLSSTNAPLDTVADHYITSPFGGGAVTLYASDQPSGGAVGTLAGGLEQIGLWSGGALSPLGGLLTLNTGAAISGGGTAAGRRVQMPWGAADISALAVDGRTLLQRSLEWATGAILVNEPIAHWKLDETAGVTAVDSIAGHDGTLVNNPIWTPGLLQGGLAFDGVDDAVDIGPDTALDDLFGGKATLTAWIYASGWGEGAYGRIADKSNATFPSAGWALELYGPIQGLLFQSAFSGGIGGWSTPAGSISLNTWHHVALVYDGSSDAKDPEIYIDGVAQVVTESNTPAGSYVSDAAYDFTIGNHAQATSRTFDGRLDDIRLFDSLLSAAEVAELAVLPGPVAHWKLDDAAGLVAIDSEGGHDGTLTNGPVWVAGALGDALDFDGSNDYVDVGSFDVIGSGITMMGWFNAEVLATDDGRIVSKASGPNEADAYWQLSSTDSGTNRHLRMRIKAGGVTTTMAAPSVNLATGQWYFAVATYDNSSGAMKLFLDGVQVASSAHAVGGALDTNPSVPVAIGANGTAERFFNGILDDVRIYDYALGAGDIADIYAANPPPTAASYTELYQPWSATADDTWQTVDLGAFGVPAGAVVEVAVINSDTGKEYFGGVRAVGSSLERRFALHEAEGGGVDAVTMHVQTDAGSQIQHYSDKWGRVSFILLGYWTGATYVERFDAFKSGANASWQSHDLGAYGVGANQVAEIAMSQTSTSVEWRVGARRSGSGLARQVTLHEAEAGGIDMVTLMTAADASSMIEVYAEADSVVDFHLLGYWSTAPGAYTENGGVFGQVSTLLTWETNSLASFGVPANAIAQFLITNEADAVDVEIGVRQTGSALNRIINIQEAESGGSDATSMHVNVDAGVNIEWYAQYGGGTRFFYPVGWWVLSP